MRLREIRAVWSSTIVANGIRHGMPVSRVEWYV